MLLLLVHIGINNHNIMFDFIIFEHSGIRNHFADLCTIGRLLRDCGYKVAIVNVTNESEECKSVNLPVLYPKAKRESFRNKTAYMKAIINEFSPMTQNMYAGSILSTTSLKWLKYVPKTQKVFLWALRSFFFTSHKRFYLSRYYPVDFVRSLYNTYITKRQKNIRFFVSNTIIRDEFVNLGYDYWRIVIREERTASQLCEPKTYHNNPLSLLSIGTLREEKRVDLCIDALEEIADHGIHFTIAGKAYKTHGYDVMLENRSRSPFVTRISSRLSDAKYNQLIDSCDYLVLCDEMQPSCVTNGTMAEALLAGKPIIAPNYNPYKFIVEKYGVGLLYDLHDKESFIEVIKRAKALSPSSFSSGIIQYQNDFLYENVLLRFAANIKETLSKH